MSYSTKRLAALPHISIKNLGIIKTKLKLKKHISFHVSRNSWATRALRKGMRIEYVSKILTHSDLKTTQIYAKIVNSELDKAMDVFNEQETKQ
jgi:integrase/recombinase XerD